MTSSPDDCKLGDNKKGTDPHLLIGPVVGLVSETTARVLVEFDCATPGRLVATDGHNTSVAEHRFKAKLPGCFSLHNLQPGTLYTYKVEGTEGCGSFRTFSGDQQVQTNVVVCSCDKGVQGRGEVDMLKVLYENICASKIDLVVRNGDQVYADKAFYAAKKILASPSTSAAEKHRMCLAGYQEFYYKTWNEGYAPKCYANCPHLMLLDDHEIRNDWGTFKHDDEPSHLDYKAGYIGRVAYYLYQRQLWDPDLNEDNAHVYQPATEGGIFKINHIGLVLVDCRGSRSWGKVENLEDRKAWIGGVQWSQLSSALNPTGELEHAKSLVLIHTTPPVYLSTEWSRCMAFSCRCQKDKMGFGLYPEEQADYFNMLLDWRNALPNREVTLVGGDLHHHMATYIYKNNTKNPVTNDMGRRTSMRNGYGFRQIVASPVSNKPPPFCIRYFIRCFMCRCCSCCGPIGIAGDWEAKHVDFKYERNFLLLSVCRRVHTTDACFFLVCFRFCSCVCLFVCTAVPFLAALPPHRPRRR